MAFFKRQKEELTKQGLKQCPRCSKPKSISEFTKNKSTKSGLSCYCIEHRKEYRINIKEKISIYNKIAIIESHKKYPWKRVLKNIQSRCNNPKNDHYKYYGLRGIECKITEKELKFLWYRDKAWLLKKPSIDRKDNDGKYELSNCQFIELVINSQKDKITVPVLQYDLNGNFIKEWKSVTEAKKILGIDNSAIHKCCKGNKNYSHSGGFIWKYKIKSF